MVTVSMTLGLQAAISNALAHIAGAEYFTFKVFGVVADVDPLGLRIVAKLVNKLGKHGVCLQPVVKLSVVTVRALQVRRVAVKVVARCVRRLLPAFTSLER
jgi:hypothetical protein